MDPNLMKFLEEDEDETMHSGADVDAFTAELNRDIEGNSSQSQQPSNSDSATAALSQGNSQAASQFLHPWQTSDGSVNFQNGQDLMVTEQTDQHLSGLEIQQQGPDSFNTKGEDGFPNALSSHHLPNTSSEIGFSNAQDDQKTFAVTQPMVTQTSGNLPVVMQNADHEPQPEVDAQMQTLQNMSDQQSLPMGSNKQQSMGMELNGQQSLPVGSNNQQSMGRALNDQQSLPVGSYNQQSMGMALNDQQSVPMGSSNLFMGMALNDQQSLQMGSNNQQSMGMELNAQQSLSTGTGNQQPIMGNGNNQDMETMSRHSTGTGMNSQQPVISGMRNQESVPSSFTQPGTSMRNRQVPFGMLLPIIQPQLDKDRAIQLQNLYFKLKKSEITKDDFLQHVRSIIGDQMLKMALYKLQTQAVKQQPPSQFPAQNQPPGRQMQVPSTVQMQTNLTNPTRDSNTSTPREVGSQADLQGAQVSQMRTSILGAVSQERKHPVYPSGINKQHMHFAQTSFPAYGSAGSSYQPFSSSATSIRPQTTAHQSMTSVKQEPADPSNEQQKAQLLSTHAQSSMPHSKQGNSTPAHPIDESFEMHSSRMGFTPPANMANSRTPPTPPTGPPKAPPRKPAVGQKKPMETPGSSPPSSKKQKVSGGFLDQSTEQLNDVVGGVNLREEEEQMLSGSKEDSWISEISRRVVQEEEEKLILQKGPLQKKVAEIMAKNGLKSMGTDVERCLSLCVEERMRGLIFNLVRLSKQRVDMEKPRHRTIITSDIKQQILTVNRKAREELEKKQAETEKLLKPTDSEGGSNGDGDKEKDKNRLKSAKVNKEEDDKMRATAANVAVRAATGGGDMLSKWQLMIEAKQKQGGTDTAPSTSQPGKDVARKPSQSSSKNTRESQEREKRDSTPFSTPASVRKAGRNQMAARRMSRSITRKDVIEILEREPQMSKSTLIYRLYEKASADPAPENT